MSPRRRWIRCMAGGGSMTTRQDRDYLLGTHDEELARLALQHRVWRPRALDAWRRAGFTVGQTLIDVGCGPCYASLDLAEMVGPSGRIVAIDRSRRFLDALEAARRGRGGGPDVGLELPLWLEDCGFETRSLRPIIDVVPRSDFVWEWPSSFMEVGLRRLVDLGRLTPDRARTISQAFATAEATPQALMVTPAVLEIIAVRR